MRNNFTFLKAFFSPFVRPKIRLYIGKTAIGTPYFFPRRWVKATPELAHKAVEDYIKREENYNKANPNYARKIKPYNEVYQEKLRYEYAIPKKIGFDFVDLGWKTKWKETDYRFEWNPVWSFVFFGYQIALTFTPVESSHYWEAWLYYTRNTDKSKSTKERLIDCMSNFSLTYTSYPSEKEIDYYKHILKNKWKNSMTE